MCDFLTKEAKKRLGFRSKIQVFVSLHKNKKGD